MSFSSQSRMGSAGTDWVSIQWLAQDEKKYKSSLNLLRSPHSFSLHLVPRRGSCVIEIKGRLIYSYFRCGDLEHLFIQSSLFFFSFQNHYVGTMINTKFPVINQSSCIDTKTYPIHPSFNCIFYFKVFQHPLSNYMAELDCKPSSMETPRGHTALFPTTQVTWINLKKANLHYMAKRLWPLSKLCVKGVVLLEQIWVSQFLCRSPTLATVWVWRSGVHKSLAS